MSRARVNLPPPKPRTRLDVEARREQLVTIATRLFARQAYDAVNMDDVAAAAGVSKALVFHYFSTKRELYVEVVAQRANDLMLATQAAAGDDALTPLARLRAGLHAYLGYVEDNGPAYAALLGAGIGMDEQISRIVEQTRSALVARIVEGLPLRTTPETRIAVRGFVGFVEAAALDWLRHRDVPRDRLVDRCIVVLGAALGLPPLPTDG